MQTAKSKKGVSVMIGYILLVSLAVIMGVGLYSWMKSYVPQEQLECPADVSVIIEDYHYNCSTQILKINLTNAGKFNVSGYIPLGSVIDSQTIPTIRLSGSLNKSASIYVYRDAIMWEDPDEATLENSNVFAPGGSSTHTYELSLSGNLTKIEITPVRWQEKENKLFFVSCGEDSSYKEIIACST